MQEINSKAIQAFGLTLEGKNNKHYYIDLPEGTANFPMFLSSLLLGSIIRKKYLNIQIIKERKDIVLYFENPERILFIAAYNYFSFFLFILKNSVLRNRWDIFNF
jgi:hypothetical protein